MLSLHDEAADAILEEIKKVPSVRRCDVSIKQSIATYFTLDFDIPLVSQLLCLL